MRHKHNELAIGVTVTVATLIVVLAILVLGKSSVITVGMRVDMMVQNAAGLGAGDQVLFRGIPIGSVQSVQLEKQGVLATLKLKGDPEIPADSKFVIREAGLLGGKTVEIQPGSSSKMLAPDARVSGEAQSGILSMAEGNSSVGSQVTEILSNINTLSGEQTLRGIYATLKSLDTTLRGLDELTQSLQGVVKENRSTVATTLANLQEMSTSADNTVGNLNQIATENRVPIKQAIASMNQSAMQLQVVVKQTNETLDRLDAILSSLQQGQGSLGKLMVDDSLYRELKTTISEIDALAKDIQQNPKKYVTFKLF